VPGKGPGIEVAKREKTGDRGGQKRKGPGIGVTRKEKARVSAPNKC